MSQKMSVETTKRGGTTLKSYASKVFQESAVGMVSSLAQTSSMTRRLFKAFVLISCLTGFFYQSAKFLTMVFEYPTVVDIDIIRPDEFNRPGYTFCNNNGLKRSLFCEKYPEHCKEADETTCNKYEGYCEPNKTLIPDEKLVANNAFFTRKDIAQLSGNLSDFLISWVDLNEITGPHLRSDDSSTVPCYSLYDRVNSSEHPQRKKKLKFLKEPANVLQFKIEENEIIKPGTRPGLVFAIHSPFEAVNPFEKGIFMKPGRTYIVYVTMEEEILLKKPYETDCINYTEQWESNGRRGPRVQETCIQKCYMEIMKYCFGCIADFMHYPTDMEICSEGPTAKPQENCTDRRITDRVETCLLSCKDDCHRTKYHYQVQEMYSVKFDKEGNVREDLDRSIFVKIYLEADEIMVFKHSPKYMIVEMFSTIGGFVGGWLGISLLDVSDIFEGFFRIIRYSFKKK